MAKVLESLRSLKKAIDTKGWFRDTRLVYQGLGPLGAHMFTHFLPVSCIISEYYGQEVQRYIEGEWGTKVFSYEKFTGVRHNESSSFNRYFYQDHGKEIAAALDALPGDVCIIPFSVTPGLEEFLFTQGSRYHLLQNTSIIQNYFDYKARLAWSAREIGIPIPPDSRVMLFGTLEYARLADEFPTGFVIQVPLSQAGGGTHFVFNEEEFQSIVAQNRKVLGLFFERTQVKITPFLSGPSLNCTGCVVNGTVALSQPDIQVVGDPYFVKTPGQYIGSDFSLNAFAPEHRQLILDITKRIGKWMGMHGYRGNFGVDFLSTVDRENRIADIYVSEVNARLVGESQYLADWQSMRDSVPLTFFHLAEWMSIDEITPAEIEAYNSSLPDLEGSALLLYTREKGTFRAKGGITSGIYRFVEEKLVRMRDGYLLSQTKGRDEFVITNGVPWEGLVLGHPRYGDYNVFICYILTRESIVEPHNWRVVNKRWREIADRVYEALTLVPCAPRTLPGEKKQTSTRE
ncbi:MAG: hypothetical protein NTZ78_02290 [Candidatus Aureabacteria bacterium]|nr:hypothetical protein [Candidatus Auribacterota bacterium]